MYKIYLLLICLSILYSCKKDGLSKNTGNIEITIPDTNDFRLNLYTELMFDNFLNFRPNTIYKEVYNGARQSNGTRILVLKDIPGGNYGYNLYWWNLNRTDVRGVKKSIVVVNNRTVKESFL